MDRSLIGHLDRAFELAYFIHRDTERALEVTITAMTRVEVLATAQDKRRYYRPVGRRSGGLGRSRRQRNRVSMSKAQLLQRLLFHTPTDDTPSEDDMTVRYVAHLARICSRRNAFHVAVGFGRLLYAYPTDQALAIYDLVAQDPERLRAPDYFRARKKLLLDELCQHFGPRLRTRRAERGELRFVTRETDGGLRRLVARSLELMTPWETRCVVPEGFQPFSGELQALRFRDASPDAEHPIEMSRLHALLHPRCLDRLTRALGLTSPAQCLEVPLLSQTQGRAGGAPPRGDRDHPPKLADADRRAVVRELDRREDLRRRVVTGVFRVLLDGVEAARWDTRRSRQLRLSASDGELVEVLGRVDGEETLLAAYLLPDLEDPAAAAVRQATVGLAGGRRFDFSISAAGIEIGFRESLARRAANHLARALGALRPRPAWRPAGALVLVVFIALSVSLLLRDRDPSPWPPQSRGPVVAAVALAEVERVFIDPLGGDLFARTLRAGLAESLAASDRIAVSIEREEADAVVTRLSRVSGAPRELVLGLVNARGEVLWRRHYSTRAPAEELAALVAGELEAAVRRGAQDP